MKQKEKRNKVLEKGERPFPKKEPLSEDMKSLEKMLEEAKDMQELINRIIGMMEKRRDTK